jgi:hypothetical protein
VVSRRLLGRPQRLGSVTEDCHLEDAEGQQHELVAVVPDFGARRGLAVLFEWNPSLAKIAARQGLGYTVLSGSYETYDRALFEDTLNDSQWRGDGVPPPWYTGSPWTE